MEDFREIPSPDSLLSRNKSVHLTQTEVSVDDAIEEIGKLNSSTSIGPNGVHQQVLMELRTEIAEF